MAVGPVRRRSALQPLKVAAKASSGVRRSVRFAAYEQLPVLLQFRLAGTPWCSSRLTFAVVSPVWAWSPRPPARSLPRPTWTSPAAASRTRPTRAGTERRPGARGRHRPARSPSIRARSRARAPSSTCLFLRGRPRTLRPPTAIIERHRLATESPRQAIGGVDPGWSCSRPGPTPIGRVPRSASGYGPGTPRRRLRTTCSTLALESTVNYGS